MAKLITGKRFASNVIVSLVAQIVSTLISLILHLVVPKFIDEFQYAHWQTYILYAGYVGVLHFGLLDGIVLRYAKYDYEELDKERIRSQFLILLITTGAMTVLSAAVSLLFLKDVTRLIVLFVAIAVVTKNLFTYSSYTCQITNRINRYAVLVIVQKAVVGAIVVVLLLLRVNNFMYYCLADIAGDVAAYILANFLNRGVFFGKAIGIKESFREYGANVSSGILLMLANWSAILLVNGAKMIIQWRWDELVFGKVSFAFSVANMFLTFITAVSVVMFPSLKRIEEGKLSATYTKARNLLSPVLFAVLIFYYPGCLVLRLWLPKYVESLEYLALLLPIIAFSSKVNLLTNNYLKVYRKEKSMLVANAISVALGIALFLIFAYAFNSLSGLLISVVVSVVFNSILSEILVARVINIHLWKEFVIEIVMTAGFILSARLLDFWIGFAVYAALFLVYCGVLLLLRYLRKRKAPAVQEESGENGDPKADQ